jgi:hypothetical protein
MKLYHGTSIRYLREIIKNGLLPRNETGNSNWEGDIKSKTGFVYLTTAYPVYFAMAICKEKEDLVIIEVNVDTDELYPDEDYIAQCLKKHDPELKHIDLKEINPLVELECYRKYWKDSLERNGNVCIKGVEPGGITRFQTIPHDDMFLIMATGGDSAPIPMNYFICGEYYRECIRVLFDDGIDKLKEFVRQKSLINFLPKKEGI